MRAVTEHARVLLAPNPGPMTLDGTNSYLLSGNGGRSSVIVDPGPLHDGHLDGLAAVGDVELILVTHRHHDHTEGAAALAAAVGAPVRAADPTFCVGGEPLRDGETVTAAGLDIGVLGTPGHTADSVCFLLTSDSPERPYGSVLTGDTILGRGTTVIAPPDGSLRDYLGSLRVLAALGHAFVLPAHGPQLPDLEGSRPSTWPTGNSGWTRSGTPWCSWAVTRASARSPTSCTTTSTRRSAARPSIRWPPSWSTCAARSSEARVTAGLDAVLPLLSCPVCRAPLTRTGGVVGCGNGHRFDVARQGHLTLLGPGSRTDTGDTSDMVAARQDFLDAGHFAPLTVAIVAAAGPGPVLDLGAGTGHHLRAVVGGDPGAVGLAIDTSRYAARRAARAPQDGHHIH